MPEEEQAFFSWRLRRGKAIRFGIALALLCFLFYEMVRGPNSGVVHLYEAVVAALVAFVGVGFYRARHVGITLTGEGVVSRTTYATKRFAWDSLVRARALEHAGARTMRSAVVPTFGKFDPPVRVVPMLELANGKALRLYGLQTIVASDDYDDWVLDAVTAINERLSELRGKPVTPG